MLFLISGEKKGVFISRFLNTSVTKTKMNQVLLLLRHISADGNATSANELLVQTNTHLGEAHAAEIINSAN